MEPPVDSISVRGFGSVLFCKDACLRLPDVASQGDFYKIDFDVRLLKLNFKRTFANRHGCYCVRFACREYSERMEGIDGEV
jgi:hypothetical protein